MFVGIGVGIGRNRFAQGIFNAYNARVVADGGITEAGNCVNAVSSLLQSASLLIIPSGYKGGKAYAEIPTNGNGDLTWTRASDAWRTNADGLIQRVPWNLFQYSEEFNNGYWYKNGTSVSANTTTAPNGTTTADSWIETNINGYHVLGKSLLALNSGSYVITIYAKAKERSKFLIFYTGTPNKGYGFDLANGTTSAVTGITSADSYSITSVGDGWYRCQIGVSASTIGTVELTMLTSFTSLPYQGDGTSGLYLWGAQLVEGSSAQTYFPTTDRLNVPRLSYMYGSCPALLLEPQRTNLVLQSNTFNTTWAVFGGATITSNSTTSPDGSTNATTLNSAGGGNDFLYQSFVTSIGTTYAISFYVKNVNSSQSKFYIPLTATPEALINWSGSTLTSVTSSATSSTFTSVGNGWYRVVVIATATTASYIFRIYSDNNNTSKSIYIYGTQCEAGAYATTYIPTTTASATRIADSFSRNNIYTNGLITSSGGTWFVELRGNIQYIRDAFSNGLQLADNNTSGGISGNGFIVRRNDTTLNRLSIQKVIAGTPTALFATATDTVKFAIKWNGTTADVFVNGIKEVSATAFTTTNMEFLLGYATDVPKFIQAMGLHPTPLSDTQLIQLTTL